MRPENYPNMTPADWAVLELIARNYVMPRFIEACGADGILPYIFPQTIRGILNAERACGRNVLASALEARLYT